MGSFTESVFAIQFRPDVPAVVLAAFRDHANPELKVTIPELEALTTLDDQHAAENLPSGFASLAEVPVEVWAWVWRSYIRPNPCAYIASDPAVRLSRPFEVLTLTARLHVQDRPESTTWWIRPLGAYAQKKTDVGYRDMVGYLRYEYDLQPTVLYLGDNGFESEPDLFVGTEHDFDELELDDELIDAVRRYVGSKIDNRDGRDLTEQAIELLKACPAPGTLLGRSQMFRTMVLEDWDDELFAIHRRVGEADFASAVDAVLTALLTSTEEETFQHRQRGRDECRREQNERLERYRQFKW
jgi:hypothetical protein